MFEYSTYRFSMMTAFSPGMGTGLETHPTVNRIIEKKKNLRQQVLILFIIL